MIFLVAQVISRLAECRVVGPADGRALVGLLPFLPAVPEVVVPEKDTRTSRTSTELQRDAEFPLGPLQGAEPPIVPQLEEASHRLVRSEERRVGKECRL